MIGYLFIKLSQASILLPLAAGLRSYRFLSRPFRVFVWLFAVCTLLEIAGAILKSTIGTNMPAYNLVPFAEFYFIVFLYWHHFAGRQFYGSLIAVSVAVFTAVGITDLLLIHGPEEMNTYAHGLECLLLMMFSLLYFRHHFMKAEPEPVTRQPMFWVNAAVFIYFSFNFVLFASAEYLIKSNIGLAMTVFKLHGMFNIIINGCFAYAFLCQKPVK